MSCQRVDLTLEIAEKTSMKESDYDDRVVSFKKRLPMVPSSSGWL